MRKFLVALLALTLALGLTACGGNETQEAPDLAAYYNDFIASLGEDNAPMMMEVTEDFMDSTYPGLSDYELNQRVIYTAAISAVAFEMALVECANESDVEAVQGIFQSRIDNQVNGGAMYPATAEAWQNAEVLVNGNVVALIVAGDYQADAVTAFNDLFQ